MSIGEVGNYSTRSLISKGNRSNSFGDFCREKYNKLFRVNSLQDEEGHMQGDSLLRFERRPDLNKLRREIRSATFRRDAHARRENYSGAFAQQSMLNDTIKKFNEIIEQKREELLEFKTSCRAHLNEQQKAVIDEERRRLEQMKLPLAVLTNQTVHPHSAAEKPKKTKKPMTWQERETIKIHEDGRREIDRRKNHFPTHLPTLFPYVVEWFLTH